MFTEKELEYLHSQPLARIATVSDDGQVDVAAVAFDFDGKYFYISGLRMVKTLKYKNTLTNGKAALVVDDLVEGNPRAPRGIKMHGIGKIVEWDGYAGQKEYIQFESTGHWSWGIHDTEQRTVVEKTIY